MNADERNSEFRNARLDDDWVVAIRREMDAMPATAADFALPETVGMLDAQLGMPCNPLEYYIRLGDIEGYILGFKQQIEEMEAAEYERGRESSIEDDYEWIRKGC